MNRSDSWVYRSIKLIRIIILLLWPSSAVFAQVQYLPFEMERFDVAYYDSVLANRDQSFSSELQALELYYLSYKKQRAATPSDYFVSPNADRKQAKSYIQKEHDNGSGMALIDFMESAGSRSSLDKLLMAKKDYALLLPYKFLAAFILNDLDKQQEYLNAMQSQGIISEVTMAYGENCLKSSSGRQELATQGLQDLIAIKSAAAKLNTDVSVFNFYAAACKGYYEKSFSELTKNSSLDIWISPTISQEFVNEYADRIEVSGIGLEIRSKAGLSPMTKQLQYINSDFKGLGIAPKTPAEKGLISSYGYYAKLLLAYGTTENNSAFIEKGNALQAYIRKSVAP